MTRAQLEALRVLADGEPHQTTRCTSGRYVGGRVADALKRRGWATCGRDADGLWWVFTITDDGRAALAAEEARRRICNS